MFNRRQFVQGTSASLLLTGIKGFSEKLPDGSRTYVQPTADENTWTVGNTLVERQIRFRPELGLSTVKWRHHVTGTDFVDNAVRPIPNGHEFSFWADEDQFSGSDPSAWQLIDVRKNNIARNGQSLEIHLRSTARPLEVNAVYAVYDGHPVIRKWIEIANLGKTPIVLSHLCFESVAIVPGPFDVLQVSAFYGIQPRELLFSGRVDDGAIVQRNSVTGEGFIVMNEAPGWTKATELIDWSGGVQVMYGTDLFPFERRLQPSETFTTAKSSIGFFVDGKSFSDPRWVVPSYTSRILVKKPLPFQPRWIYNTWEPFHRQITADLVTQLIDIAAGMGMDVFTIDDGWQSQTGDNRINLQLFPNGLDEIQTAVEGKGMRLGLWVPFTVVSTQTPVYREHPEWACKDRHGELKLTETMSGHNVVMCLACPYKEAAAKRISELIARYRLGYVKLDLTTVFNAYGESPGCYAQGHGHEGWAESLTLIYESMQYVTDYIYKAHPDVLLDITFEAWGQKHTIDYGLLAAADLDWLSNVEDKWPDAAGPRQARVLLYQRSLAIPTEAMLIGNLLAEMAPIEERLLTAMGAAPLLLGDLRKLSREQQSWYRENIHSFKALRRQVQMTDGFFPLGEWKQPGAETWDGFARLSRQGEGMIALFRNRAPLKAAEVKMPSFPDGNYHLRSLITNQWKTCTGQQFRDGIEVPFPLDHTIEILEVRSS